MRAGWWHPTVKDGRVHDHPEHPNNAWSTAMHRLCEPLYKARNVAEGQLLGKNVRVTLDKPSGEPAVIAEGQLLGFGDGGDVQLLDEMGFVHHCWPMLDITEVAERG